MLVDKNVHHLTNIVLQRTLTQVRLTQQPLATERCNPQFPRKAQGRPMFLGAYTTAYVTCAFQGSHPRKVLSLRYLTLLTPDMLLLSDTVHFLAVHLILRPLYLNP